MAPQDTNGASSSRKPVRHKPTYNCSECIRRKKRCGRERPVCEVCVKSDRAERCQYKRAITLNLPELDKQSVAMLVSRLCARIDELEHQQSGLAAISDTSHQCPGQTKGNSTETRDEGQVYFGRPVSNAPMMGRVIERAPRDETSYPFKSLAALKTAKDLRCFFPLEATSKSYISYAYSGFGFLFGYFDEIWALQRLTECREAAEPDMILVAYIFSLFAIGAHLSQSNISDNEDDRGTSAASFYISVCMQGLRNSGMLLQTGLLNAQIIYNMTLFILMCGRPHTAWHFSGLLVRHSVSLGLHRDPEVLVNVTDPNIVERRRRLFTNFRYLDTLLSVLFWRPYGFHTFDARPCDLPLIRYQADISGAVIGFLESAYREETERQAYYAAACEQCLDSLNRNAADGSFAFGFLKMSLLHVMVIANRSACMQRFLPHSEDAIAVEGSKHFVTLDYALSCVECFTDLLSSYRLLTCNSWILHFWLFVSTHTLMEVCYLPTDFLNSVDPSGHVQLVCSRAAIAVEPAVSFFTEHAASSSFYKRCCSVLETLPKRTGASNPAGGSVANTERFNGFQDMFNDDSISDFLQQWDQLFEWPY